MLSQGPIFLALRSHSRCVDRLPPRFSGVHCGQFRLLFLFPPHFMSKQDLITNIANAAGITKRAASDALEAVTNLITKELKKGNNVTITGFGTFRVSKRAARKGVNPRNPTQKISIPAMKVPSFKAGKTLKDAVR